MELKMNKKDLLRAIIVIIGLMFLLWKVDFIYVATAICLYIISEIIIKIIKERKQKR